MSLSGLFRTTRTDDDDELDTEDDFGDTASQVSRASSMKRSARDGDEDDVARVEAEIAKVERSVEKVEGKLVKVEGSRTPS